MDAIIGKEQFLIEHNRLSPKNLKATFSLLTKFQAEKRPLLKDAEWSLKLRIPFISWLVAFRPEVLEEKEKSEKMWGEQTYKNYPETH